MVIEVNIIVTAVLGFISVLTVGVSFALRRDEALLWASGCFACATVQNLTIYFGPGSKLEAVTSVLVATIAFWFANQTICALTGEKRARIYLNGAFFGLLGTALVMLAMDSAAQYQAVTAECARLTAILDASWRLSSAKRASPLRHFLLASFVALALLRMVRIIRALEQPDIDFHRINSSSAEMAMALGESLLAILIIVVLIADVVSKTIMRFRVQSEQDSLTGLLNRRGLETIAAKRSPTGGAVICADIDHFKSINDRFGHQAGDCVIASVGAIFANLGRPAGRIGGEEFAIIVDGFSLPEAMTLAETMRGKVTATRYAGLPDIVRVTASFGVSAYAPGLPPASAFQAADQALYRAKREGRNAVAVDPAPVHLPEKASLCA